jgi:hypothetical protein
MKYLSLAAVTLIGLAATFSAARADVVQFYFNSTFDAEPLSATGTLDVTGGVVTDGSGTLTVGPNTYSIYAYLTIAPPNTYESNGGDDITGDNIYPFDTTGIVFGNQPTYARVKDLLFGIGSNGTDPASYYYELYGYGGTPTVRYYTSADGTLRIPEPTSMAVLGTALLGLGLFWRRRRRIG